MGFMGGLVEGSLTRSSGGFGRGGSRRYRYGALWAWSRRGDGERQ
jgi:hypothetical protein